MEKVYESENETYKGVSSEINTYNCPESWKDIFIFIEPRGRSHFVPSVSVVLAEVASSRWVFRTFCGDFKPIAKEAILDMVMAGIREFSVIPTTYEIELQG